tara:strand:- start:123 stop:467 length:345 start_codon:yes stop_codon:yes gene_type:complete
MSVIIKEGREKLLKILEANTRHRTFEQSLNSRDFCLICGKGRSVDNSSGVPYELIRHHVQYFPALICYVHYLCHRKIHDTPLVNFIQYKEGEPRKYYSKKPTMLKQKNYERILE